MLTESISNIQWGVTNVIYLPRSSKLSNILTALAWCEGAIDSLMPGLPGWITRTRATPRTALSNDVNMKYTKVRTAIIPFILAFRLAEPKNTRNSWMKFVLYVCMCGLILYEYRWKRKLYRILDWQSPMVRSSILTIS